jgi:nitroreductase
MLLEAIRKRRSIRKYSKKKVSEKKIKEIIKAGQFAPCGRNRKEWEFIVVQDKKILNKLSKFKEHAAGFIADANACLVVIGDKEKNDLWVENCVLAAGYMFLQAEALGISSCWINVHQTNQNPNAERDVRKILKVPDRFGVLCILPLGYSIEKLPAHSDKDFDRNKIHYNKF